MRTSTYLGVAWHGWFHLIGNTYGTWVRGDPKGWRARRHREHVEGDYKHPPPPELYADLYEASLNRMSRDAVVLTPEARRVVCQTMAEALQYHDVQLIEMSVGTMHYHILARFPAPTSGGR